MKPGTICDNSLRFQIAEFEADAIVFQNHALVTCRVPDDCIDSRRYPLFMPREFMRGLTGNRLKIEVGL